MKIIIYQPHTRNSGMGGLHNLLCRNDFLRNEKRSLSAFVAKQQQWGQLC